MFLQLSVVNSLGEDLSCSSAQRLADKLRGRRQVGAPVLHRCLCGERVSFIGLFGSAPSSDRSTSARGDWTEAKCKKSIGPS
jgi:hypothetical protein